MAAADLRMGPPPLGHSMGKSYPGGGRALVAGRPGQLLLDQQAKSTRAARSEIDLVRGLDRRGTGFGQCYFLTLVPTISSDVSPLIVS